MSVVIPTLGRSEAMGEVVGGILRQQPESDVEVLIVVDALGSRDRVEPLPGAAPRLRWSVLQAPRPGASAARNAGWRRAQAPLILFLDDDIVPHAGLIAEHLRWHDQHPVPEVGILGAVRWSPQVKVTPFMRWLETGIQFDYDGIEDADAGWGRFYSCNVSVKRSMLERVGGFDELAFPFGYEDLDLGRRMADHGFRLLYNSQAAGEHLKTETLEGWRRNLQRTAAAERRFCARYPETPPYFYERFREALDAPRARGRTARLVRWVPPGLPWLGPIVWRSYDRVCLQRLGPEFVAAWDAAGIDPQSDHGR